MNDQGSIPTDREGVCDLVPLESDSHGASSLLYYLRNRLKSIFRMSDQGVQYAATGYTTLLQAAQVQISMSARGRPTENAFVERFMRTLKEEEVSLNQYEDLADARDNLSHFLDHVYQQKRIHSSLGYLTPAEFEAYWNAGFIETSDS